MEEREGVRLNKYLSEIGYCSRREADKLIEDGRVTVNGRKSYTGIKISYRDRVSVDGIKVSNELDKPVYIAFHKPVGIVSTTDTKSEKNNIIDYIRHEKRIFPIGRLDKLSEGLIFLTSDGDIVNKILRSNNNHEKEYIVTVDRPITDYFIEKMGSGIPILGITTKKCKVTQVNKFTFTIVLTQGLNRQIRRMCEFLGYEVMKLKRTRIMDVVLDVPVGQWRDLREKEIETIQKQLATSSSTTKAKAISKKKNVAANTKRKKPAFTKDTKKKHVNSIGKSKTAKGKRR